MKKLVTLNKLEFYQIREIIEQIDTNSVSMDEFLFIQCILPEEDEIKRM